MDKATRLVTRLLLICRAKQMVGHLFRERVHHQQTTAGQNKEGRGHANKEVLQLLAITAVHLCLAH